MKRILATVVLVGISWNVLALNKTPSFEVGVYYFPGWTFEAPLMNKEPWDRIKKFPEREPLLGWYDDRSGDIASQHIKWMSDYGIDFVIYDWYWVGGYGVRLNQALEAYKGLKNKRGVKFSILWANHTSTPSSIKQFDQIVDYWIENYFKNEDFKSADGKPMVFIFSPYLLNQDAKKFGSTAEKLLKRADERARGKGLKGIYFVASTQAQDQSVKKILPSQGYSAYSGYNYHHGSSGTAVNRTPSLSYRELSRGYQEVWNWMIENSALPYIPPVTAGWDRRPWGGSKVPGHDNSFSSPETFREHLEKAAELVRKNPEKTRRSVVICCWNEYGEGSYIEPTKKYGMQYLEIIRDVKSR